MKEVSLILNGQRYYCVYWVTQYYKLKEFRGTLTGNFQCDFHFLVLEDRIHIPADLPVEFHPIIPLIKTHNETA